MDRQLQRIGKAASAREAAEEAFRAEIRTAYATGRYSLAELARAAGISKQRAHQIVHFTR